MSLLGWGERMLRGRLNVSRQREMRIALWNPDSGLGLKVVGR